MSEAEASVGSGVAEGGAAAAPAPSEAAADKPKIARPKRPTATTTESPATVSGAHPLTFFEGLRILPLLAAGANSSLVRHDYSN